METLPEEGSRNMEEMEGEYPEEQFDESSSSDDETGNAVTERKADELQPAQMEALQNLSAEELEGGDTELILFRVPRHTRLRGALKGSKFNISVTGNIIDKKMAVYQGSYVVRDCGTKRCKQVRPMFILEGRNGTSHLQMGKPFSRLVTITFDMKISSLGDQKPAPRRYPNAKKGLGLKYHPLGKILPDERRTKPDHANPEKGMTSVSVELLSTSCGVSRNVRTDDALVLTEFLRTLISPHIDLSKLCIEPGKLVWNLCLTVYCIDHDGNLEDSVVLAAVAALRDVRLPTVRMTDEQANEVENGDENDEMKTEQHGVEEENGSAVAVVSAERTESLEIDNFPLTVSFQIFCEKALIDPSAEEENVCASRVTFILRPSGALKGILKPGGHNFSEQLCNNCLKQSQKRAAEYMKVLAGDG
ncbi:unnamed protein product [Agarophyton chilense]